MSRLGPSPLPTQPDSDPMAWCESCELKYNPYKSGLRCPECNA